MPIQLNYVENHLQYLQTLQSDMFWDATAFSTPTALARPAVYVCNALADFAGRYFYVFSSCVKITSS